MKKISISLVVLVFSVAAFSQNPVSWSFGSKKIEENKYEIVLTATVQSPWHIYSQHTPEGGPVPTTVSFTKHPLIEIDGSAKEVGKLIKKHEEVFGVDVKYFDGGVSFVQKIKLKGKVKTAINGSVEYMVCNDTQCLPPKTVPFSVMIK